MLDTLNNFLGPAPLKLVIFDLDGTLVDSVYDLKAALDDMYRALAMPSASLEQVRSWVGNGARVLVERALSYDQEVSEACLDQIEHAYALFLESYQHCNGQSAVLYEGARELLTVLAQTDVRVAIITNKPEQFTLPLLKKLQINVHHVLSGDSLPLKKPDPLPLHECLAFFNCGADEAVMIGDSASDILAARAAGVKSIAVSYGYNHGVPISDYQPDLLVDSLQELR